MKQVIAFSLISVLALPVLAGGFGVNIGAYSPTSGLDDNDNAVLLGAEYSHKFLFFGLKLEGYFVDSSGNYTSVLGEEFGRAQVDIDSIFALDFMFYPAGGLFYLQAGLNHTAMDFSDIDIDGIDNELGLDLGAGITFFDKLHIQGKILYTPDAIGDDAVDTLENLDNNLLGYMITAGWRF